MIIQLTYQGQLYQCDLSKPIDISIPLGQVNCFFAPDFSSQPFTSGDFIGSVKHGSPVNFFNVQLNPHGNGTHTECVGHITEDQESIMDHLTEYHFFAQVVSVELEERENGDRIISKQILQSACPSLLPEAIVIRSLPNSKEKLQLNYSGSNPPYLEKEAMDFLVERGIKHLLIDLPSVDREEDEGKLLGHRSFWATKGAQVNESSRHGCTITELVFVPNEVKDGVYFLNLQIPSINLDAAPSKPVLFPLYILAETLTN